MSPEEGMIRRGPLDGRSLKGDVVIVPAPPSSRFIFRGNSSALIAAGRAFGVAFPERAEQAALIGARAVLWLGPDEWLLLASPEDGAAIREEIERGVGGDPHSLVEVSHRQTAIEVSGPAAAMALNAGCPLDLDEGAFPVNRCTRTVLEKSEIVLWRTEPRTFRLEVWRSYADYVWKVLREASREFTPRR